MQIIGEENLLLLFGIEKSHLQSIQRKTHLLCSNIFESII